MARPLARLGWLCVWIVSIVLALGIYHLVMTGQWRTLTHRVRKTVVDKLRSTAAALDSNAIPASAPAAAHQPAASLAPSALRGPLFTQTVRRVVEPNLIRNGAFRNTLEAWEPWQYAKSSPELARVVKVRDGSAVRIASPRGQLAGVIQGVPVISGGLYRLRARARAAATQPGAVFGGRIGFNCPPQLEQQLLWPNYDATWVEHALIFTNHVTGTASVFAHLGYGSASATGEFTEISLERVVITQVVSSVAPCQLAPVDDASTLPTNVIWHLHKGQTTEFSSLCEALVQVESHDTLLVNPGVYVETNYGPAWLTVQRKNVRIVGRGLPVALFGAHDAGYQISLQMPHNQNLSFENMCIATLVTANNNDRVCGIVGTACNGLLLSNCILYAELHCTNSVYQNLVAVNGAANVQVIGGAMVCNDMTGANRIFQASTHGSEAARFTRVLFAGKGVDRIANGDARFIDCYVLGTPERQYQGMTQLPAKLNLPAAVQRLRDLCVGVSR